MAAPAADPPLIDPVPAAVIGDTNRSNAGSDNPARPRIAIPAKVPISAELVGSVVVKLCPPLSSRNPEA